tara:strand:+ start:213 stop:728 length:516 start_codon:yes stop_codon:yes gene_type:complete
MKYIIKNILTNKERKKLIEDCKPHLIDGKELTKIYGGGKFPAKQTKETIYNIPCFTDPINKILRTVVKTVKEDLVLHRVWINCTTGKDEDALWHNHIPLKWSCVYYMKTIPFIDSGTLFKDGFMRAPQNSLIIFPANLDHRPPTSPFRFERYSMALDLMPPSRNPPTRVIR